MIGVGVQKLRFLIRIGNALGLPQKIDGLRGFSCEGLKLYFSELQNALHYGETRLLTYSA